MYCHFTQNFQLQRTSTPVAGMSELHDIPSVSFIGEGATPKRHHRSLGLSMASHAPPELPKCIEMRDALMTKVQHMQVSLTLLIN